MSKDSATAVRDLTTAGYDDIMYVPDDSWDDEREDDTEEDRGGDPSSSDEEDGGVRHEENGVSDVPPRPLSPFGSVSIRLMGSGASSDSGQPRAELIFAQEALKQQIYYLQQGGLLKKKLEKGKDYRDRFVFLNEEITCLCWAKSQSTRLQAKAVPIHGMSVRRGPPRVAHKRDLADLNFGCGTLTVGLAKKWEGGLGIDFWCPSESSCDEWATALTDVLYFLQADFPPGSLEAEFRSGLKQDLLNRSFLSYAERRLTRQGARRKHPAAIMGFTSRPLKNGLYLVAPTLQTHCTTMFELVMRYMGDLDPGRDSTGNWDILQKVVGMAEGLAALRDELYCQLVKQTRDNPGQDSLIRGWQLLAACTHRFLPEEEELRDNVILHLARARGRPDAVGGLAYYAHGLVTAGGGGGRWSKRPPITREELSRIQADFVPPSVFGGTLDDVLRKELIAAKPDVRMPTKGSLEACSLVPVIVQVLIRKILALDGLTTEGLFRKAGEKGEVTTYKRRLRNGCYAVHAAQALDMEDVHVVADLLKLWLRCLAEPLIPYRFYDRALAIGGRDRDTDYLPVYKLLQELPSAHQQTLKHILRFLNNCADCSGSSHMDKNNLALVFSPNLLRNPANDPLIMAANTELEKKFVMILMDAVRYLVDT